MWSWLARRLGPLVASWLALACTERIPLPTPEPEADAAIEIPSGEDAGVDMAPTSRDTLSDGRGTSTFDAARGDRAQMCSETLFQLRARADIPELIVALDHSSSMGGTWGSTSRLTAAQQAIKSAVRTYGGAVHFGYLTYPASPGTVGLCTGCCSGPIEVPPGPNRAASFERAMACNVPMGCQLATEVSPVAEALRRGRQFFESFESDARSRWMLVVADGEPTCPLERNPCERAALEASVLASKGVRTVVATLGAEIKGNDCMDALALAGAAARPVAPFPFHAESADELSTLLREVSSAVAARSCQLNLLSSVPPNADSVVVLFQGMRVPRDGARRDGWNFDQNSQQRITVHGNWCDRLKTSDVQESVQVFASFCR